MLFLLNDQVFDLGDPVAALEETARVFGGIRHDQMSARASFEMAQAIYFKAGARRPGVAGRRFLAALIANRFDANAAIFLRPANARSAADVVGRLALVQLTVLSHLAQLQTGDSLPARLVNESVWMHAA